MVTRLQSLVEVADQFEAIVFDQFGVLHDGTSAYPSAVQATKELRNAGARLAVLTNSGKRADLNHKRITAMGFSHGTFETVMSSGEAVWRDLQARNNISRLFPITAAPNDPQNWAEDLHLTFSDNVADAQAILLMGLPDFGNHAAARAALDKALAQNLPVLCSNPDRAAPRADGKTVISPGALAHDYASAGGHVTFYGKPHLPIFTALQSALGIKHASRLLMVGDSLEHDIAGGHAAGWSTAFIEGGLHACHFARTEDPIPKLMSLAASEGTALPTYSLSLLR